MDIVYTTSGLFKKFQQNSNDIDEIKSIFNHKIGEFHLTKYKIYKFLNDYKTIDSNSDSNFENIKKYSHLVTFFDYEIKKQFFEYIFEKYFLNDITTKIKNQNINLIKELKKYVLFEQIIEQYYKKENKFGITPFSVKNGTLKSKISV